MMRVLGTAGVRSASTELAWLLLTLVTTGCLAGCFARRPVDPPVVESAHEMGLPYRIHVGDTLDVRFYSTPELNTKATVRSRSEEHTSELQSLTNHVCRLLM